MTTRRIRHHYTDPLDLVWTRAAADLGWTIRRSSETYASFDGVDTLTIALPDDFDPDDCLAQMVLHEICHALVAGPEQTTQQDYGLENADDRDLVQEHATHRLQAHLAQRWGLRDVFAVTTDWRPYWDRLPLNPLGDGPDPAIPLARQGLESAQVEPFAGALRRAFAATRLIVNVVAPIAPDDALANAARRPLAHPVGGCAGPDNERCGTCAWFIAADGDKPGACQMHAIGERPPPSTDAETHACVRWEPRLDATACIACGACCREAFQAVPVEETSPLLQTRPTWIARDIEGFGPYLPRPGGRCVALPKAGAPWLCSAYGDRPQSCRDFEMNGPNCLEARQRVGLSLRTC